MGPSSPGPVWRWRGTPLSLRLDSIARSQTRTHTWSTIPPSCVTLSGLSHPPGRDDTMPVGGCIIWGVHTFRSRYVLVILATGLEVHHNLDPDPSATAGVSHNS